MTDHQQQSGKTDLLDRPGTVARLVWILVALCAVLLALDVLVDHTGPYAIRRLFGFYAIFAFVASLVLVFLTRVASPVSTRREDYYDA
jgi:hypothetical protein